MGARSTSRTASGFAGFPLEALAFFDDLEEHNERAWFLANRDRYDTHVRSPIDTFLAGVAGEFGQGHVFRPNRDTRFSHDKTPYKTNIGAVVNDGGAVYYVHLDGGGLFAASGYYMMSSDQIARFRRAVADDTSGAELEAILAAARKAKLRASEPALQRVPSPWPKDHQRGALLRTKSMTLGREFGIPAWLATPRAGDEVVKVWRAARPLNDWLARHVGPATTVAERGR
jgi:uncharacterized protein (TIGR02453 family)